MNIPWKTSDVDSAPLGTTTSPIPNTPITSPQVDVRGYDWVEFNISWTGNSGALPATQLTLTVLYGDASSGFSTLTVENVGANGDAPQSDWSPRRSIAGQVSGSWRIPVPVHGSLMKITVLADGVPAGTSTLDIRTYRRSF